MAMTSASTNRACDQCRRRKVRCDGPGPSARCQNCVQISCGCTFNERPRKRGPKRHTGRVITELRRTAAPPHANPSRESELQRRHCSAECRRQSTPEFQQWQQQQDVNDQQVQVQVQGSRLSRPQIVYDELAPDGEGQRQRRHQQREHAAGISTRGQTQHQGEAHPQLLPHGKRGMTVQTIPNHLGLISSVPTANYGDENTDDNDDQDEHEEHVDDEEEGHLLAAALYPTPPVLDHLDLGSILLSPANAPSHLYCLSSALLAYTLIRVSSSANDKHPASVNRCVAWADTLLHEVSDNLDTLDASSCTYSTPTIAPDPTGAISASLPLLPGISSTDLPAKLVPITTHLVLYHCYRALGRNTQAWNYLNQSARLAWAAGLHRVSLYEALEADSREQHLCLYRLLFVTQCAQALELKFVPTLTSNSQVLDPVVCRRDSVTAFASFPSTLQTYRSLGDRLGLLANLYLACYEDIFTWNNLNYDQEVDATKLIQMCERLESACCPWIDLDEYFTIDLKCTQLWLLVLLWEISLHRGFLSASAAQKALQLDFPIHAAQEVVKIFEARLSVSFGPHGIGLVRTLQAAFKGNNWLTSKFQAAKICHIACTCLDVVLCMTTDHTFGEWPPMALLSRLKELLFLLNDGKAGSYVKQLDAKVLIAGLTPL